MSTSGRRRPPARLGTAAPEPLSAVAREHKATSGAEAHTHKRPCAQSAGPRKWRKKYRPVGTRACSYHAPQGHVSRTVGRKWASAVPPKMTAEGRQRKNCKGPSGSGRGNVAADHGGRRTREPDLHLLRPGGQQTAHLGHRTLRAYAGATVLRTGWRGSCKQGLGAYPTGRGPISEHTHPDRRARRPRI